MSPMDYLLGLFETAFAAVFTWFFQLLSASGAIGVYLAVFAMYCIVRFLIVPIIGSRDKEDVGDY